MKKAMSVVFLTGLFLIFTAGLGLADNTEWCFDFDDHTDNTEQIILRLGVLELGHNHYLLGGTLTFTVTTPSYSVTKTLVGSADLINGKLEISLFGNDMDRAVGDEKIQLRWSRIHISADPGTFIGSGRGYIAHESAEYYYDISVTPKKCEPIAGPKIAFPYE